MKRLLLLTIALMPNLAFADTVNWRVNEVVTLIMARNFKLEAAKAYLECRFEDGSGIISGTPRKMLETTITVFGRDNEVGGIYHLRIEKGNLWSFRPLADLKSCRYGLKLVSNQALPVEGGFATANLELAGTWTDMTDDELAKLLENPNLAAELSDKYNNIVIDYDPEHWTFEVVSP